MFYYISTNFKSGMGRKELLKYTIKAYTNYTIIIVISIEIIDE